MGGGGRRILEEDHTHGVGRQRRTPPMKPRTSFTFKDNMFYQHHRRESQTDVMIVVMIIVIISIVKYIVMVVVAVVVTIAIAVVIVDDFSLFVEELET